MDGLKIVAVAQDDNGDKQQVVIERPIAATEGEKSEGKGMGIDQAATALYGMVLEELGKVGLALPPEEENAMQIKLTLALLHGGGEVQLRASFKPKPPGEKPAKEQ